MLATYRPVNSDLIHATQPPYCDSAFCFVFYIQHKVWIIFFCFVLLNQGLKFILFVKKKTFPFLLWCYLLFYSGSFSVL